jgi:hypothetical protein
METVNGGAFKSVLAKSSASFRNTMSPSAKKGVSPAVNRTKVKPFGEQKINTPTKAKKAQPETIAEVTLAYTKGEGLRSIYS